MSRPKTSQSAKSTNQNQNQAGRKSKSRRIKKHNRHKSKQNKHYNKNHQDDKNLKTMSNSPRSDSDSPVDDDHWQEIWETRLYAERRYVDPLGQEVPFFHTTHSILAFFAAIIPTLIVAFIYRPQTVEDATRKAIYLGILYYLIIGLMIFPSGPFVRPHPLLWRTVFAISLIYLFCLLIVLLLPNNIVTEVFIPFILNDNTLGTRLVLPDYATDCTLNWTNFAKKLDRFVFAHFAGWFFKAILIRNRFLLWSMSLIWELIELSLVYFVPNFGECWWDSYLMDFLICNGLGIEIGLLWCQFGTKYDTYHWSPLLSGSKVYDKIKNNLKRCFVLFFTPEHWHATSWEPFNSSKQFFQVHLVLLLMCAIELNAFLLKLYLWIPTDHWFNIARCVLFWLVCMPAVRQYYFYVTDPNIKRMGSQVWVLFMLVVLETAIVVKMTPPDMPRAPWVNVIAWTLAAMVYLGWNYVMCTEIKLPRIHN